MATHSDDDATIPKAFQDLLRGTEKSVRDQMAEDMEGLHKKAERMITRGESEITVGRDGERVLLEAVAGGFYVRKLPADEHGVLRASIGEHPSVPKSAYLTIRGDARQIERLLRRAVKALRAAMQSEEVAP